MKTIGKPQVLALKDHPDGTLWRWWMGIIIGMVLWAPTLSHSQDPLRGTMNPHADMSDPAIPAKGVIGVAIHLTAERVGDPASLIIRATHPAGPAAKAGLMHGQEILAVDGVALAGKTYREIVEMIRGKIGQPVTLRVKTFTDVKEVTLTRVGEDQLVSEHQT